MKQIRKQIGSLLLSVCMVVTMLPTVAFAEEGVQDSGTAPGTSEITAFADLAEDVALQKVEIGTTLEELNLPSTLTATVTTSSAMTVAVSGDEVATDSEAQETETQEETTIDVSNWTADPDYDGETAGDYTFTPTLTIPEGTTLADGVTAPQITVTVEETAAPILRGAEMSLLGTGTDTDITDKFTDDNFLAAVYAKIGKTASETIYDTDVSGITSLKVNNKSIESLAGIEYFTALTELECGINQLTALDVSSNTALKYLFCSENQLTALDVSSNTKLVGLGCANNQLTALDVSSNTVLTTLICSSNYMTDKSAVKGLDENLTTITFNPQNTSTSTYTITVNSGTASPTTAAAGANVTITANTPDSGKQFKEWTAVSGGVTLASNTSATTTFTMPANAVVVTATYEDIPTGGTDITAKFTDANFLAAVYAKIGKTAPEAIYDTDVSGITSLNVREMSIESLAGIEYFTGLTELYCFFNQLTALDVSSNTSLTTLNFSGNQLTTLDVSNNTALTYLDCSNNQLTTLDVSKNTALTNLYCYNNKLTTLNVSKNTALKSLRCDENYMPDKSSVTGLDTDLTTDFIYEPQKETYAITVNNGTANLSKGAPGATVTITANTPDNGKAFREWKVVSGGVTLSSNTSATTTFTMPSCKVEVTAIYDTDITDKFTDVNFLAAVRHALGIEADASIYKTDVSGITFLNVPGKKITSLDGIEYFTALTRLDCYDNQLTALDISNNTKLTNLSCEYNQLTDLNLSNNTALTILYCQRNQLTNLKVSNNTALKKLYCQSNQLTKLDLSNNTALTTLNCSWNQLTALDVSKNTALTNLYCYDNQLTVLNISSNTALTTLDCSINYLSALNVDKNKALKNLYCGSNPLTGLTVSSNTALTSLACSSNHLTVLDVSLNTALTSLDCSQNQLTVLIVSNNTALTSLNCNSNHLTELDVSSNTKLTSLNCAYNNMTGESSVTGLDKDLTTDLTLAPQNTSSPISTDITDKFTDPNFLAFVRKLLGNSSDASIYDTDVSGITSLDVSGNGIASLAGIDSFISLKYLYCSDNQLTVLNISSNTALKSLECGNNPLTYLDVSKNTALERLDCYENQLTKLDVSKNTALTNLCCYENQLTKLDVSKNTALTNLLCYSNQLTALDVSSNTKLTQMRCYDNYMTDESAVVGLDKKLTKLFKFAPQNTVPSTYTITVNSGTANLSIAAENATVTITANTPDSGKQFKEWTVESGGVTFDRATSASTTFTMPANAVEVTATYEDIPAGVTSVRGVTLSKNNLSLYSNTTPNTAALTATVAPADATDQSVTWQSSNTAVATVDASGNVKAVGNGTATITVTTTDGDYTASCTVTVSTYSSGGSSSGGSSGGGSSSSGSSATTTTTTTTTPEKKPNQPVTAAASITATAGTSGAASASIPDQSISDAITKAQADAKAQGKTTDGISVALNVTMPKGASALTATLTRSSLNRLVNAGATNLEIKGSPVTVTFDKKTLTQIQKKTSGNINITIAPNTNLSEAAKKMIGTRPVYNITVGYGNNSTVSSFGDGVATVAIPYSPANGEAIGGVYAVYVDEKGNATRIVGSAYDANSGCVIFTTPHFSMYGVGYTAPSAQFTDISSHWAKESIDYVVGRGLLSGTTETTFAPDTAMTRGMLVTALGRLAGVDTKTYTTSNFIDVNADSAYRPYIEWAYKKEMIQGIGSNQFAPDRAITREEIAVIIANFAKATGYTLPVTREATTYADASSIGSTYKTAVTAMHQAGIMMGGTSNKFNPKSNATRAEVSSMLKRYIKLTIDPDTAQNWTLNDAGHYLYYKDGKTLTGTQTIEGVKYVFNSNGVLQTGWVKDGNNWRFYSGKTMLVGFWDLGANGNNKTYYFAKDGLMVSGKWLEIDGKWYYFNTDGSLARSTKIDGYEVDENGVRKTK